MKLPRLAAAFLTILSLGNPVTVTGQFTDSCMTTVNISASQIVQGDNVTVAVTGPVGESGVVSWGDNEARGYDQTEPTVFLTHTYWHAGFNSINITYSCGNETFTVSPALNVTVLNAAASVVLSGIPSTPQVLTSRYYATAQITCCDVGTTHDRRTIWIDWNDGSANGTSQGTCGSSLQKCTTFRFEKNYFAVGTYHISAGVMDMNGARSIADGATATLVLCNPKVRLTTNTSTMEQPSGTFISEGSSTTVTFTGVIGGSLSATVDWGDGSVVSSGANASYTHIYLNHGTYSIHTTYTYSNLPTFQGYSDFIVYVTNVAPSIVISGIGIPDHGREVPFNVTIFITCSDGAIDDERIFVDWGDGWPSSIMSVKAPSSANCQNLTFSHLYENNGTFDITATVTDSGGLQAVAIFGLGVVDGPSVILSNSSIMEGDSTTVTVIGGHSFRYIHWGDGSVSRGPNSSYTHTYLQDGDYLIEANYSFGWPPIKGQKQLPVRVANAVPSIVMSGIPNTTQAVPYNATVLVTCSDMGVLDDEVIFINWNDSSPASKYNVSAPASANCKGLSFSHQFPNAGTYTVHATVQEKNGVASAVKTSTLVTACVLPTVSLPNTTIMEGVPFNITFTSQRNMPVLAEVNWGDGSIFESGKKTFFTHKYVNEGKYTIKTNYNDTPGCTGNMTFSIAVQNVAPLLQLLTMQTAPYTAAASVTCFDYGISDSQSIYVRWNDSSPDAGWAVAAPTTDHCINVVFTHKYAMVGTYHISAIVMDNGGAFSEMAWSTVKISNRRLLRGVDSDIPGNDNNHGQGMNLPEVEQTELAPQGGM